MIASRQSMATSKLPRLTPNAALTMGTGLLAVVAVATALAVADDSRGRPALALMAPVVDLLVAAGDTLVARPWRLLDWPAITVAAALAVAAVAAARRRRDRPWAAALLGAAACAAVGELLLLHRLVAGGAVLLALAVAAAVVAACSPGAPPPVVDRRPPRLQWPEVALLLAIAAVAAVFRFYALNRVVDYFEGELSPYMAGATSLGGILPANAGYHGPWAPLGVLYYLPIHVMTLLAGSTPLAVRLASAAIAVLTIAAAWLLAREVAGRRAALAAAAILALDPLQIGWGRSDVHPHGVTAWPGLLLAWATLRMLRTGRTRWCLAVAALMALSWHQYPSGQVVALVPLLAIGVLAAARRLEVRALGWRLGFVGAGLLLWLAGYPLAAWLGGLPVRSPLGYVALLGPRFSGTGYGGPVLSAWAHLRHLAGNAADIVVGIFAAVPHLFHQTFLPRAGDLPVRSLPLLVACLAALGVALLFARRITPATAVIGSLLVTTAAPAVLADVAYVKRAAVLYPVLEIVAAIALVQLLRALEEGCGARATVVAGAAVGLVFAVWASLAATLWFSGHPYRWGTPPEVEIADAVARRLAPGSLVLAGTESNYMPGKLTYLLADAVRRPDLQPVAWLVTPTDSDLWRTLAEEPGAAFAELARRPWYSSWSGQDRRLPEPRAALAWHQVVYLVERRQGGDNQLARIRERCPEATVEELAAGTDERYEFSLATCPRPPW